MIVEAPGPGALADLERLSPARRSEAKMNCVKLLGRRLIYHDFDRQVAEVRIRVAVLDRLTALGIPMFVAAG